MSEDSSCLRQLGYRDRRYSDNSESEFEDNKIGFIFETAESQFNSVDRSRYLSKIHRTLVVIFRRDIVLLPTAYSAPRCIKTFGTRRSKVKNEYRIQDGGRSGAGMPHILDE
jgi:hypothetical protein